MRRLLVAWIVGTFLVVAAAPLVAQQGTSEIGGKAVDDQGAVLPGVTIVLTNEGTGRTREITTGADGSFFASQLVPGRYKITARLAFKNATTTPATRRVKKKISSESIRYVAGMKRLRSINM